MDINQYYLNNGNFVRASHYYQYGQYDQYNNNLSYNQAQFQFQPQPQQQYMPGYGEHVQYFDNRNYTMYVNNNNNAFSGYNNSNLLPPPLAIPLPQQSYGYVTTFHNPPNLRTSNNYKSMQDVNVFIDHPRYQISNPSPLISENVETIDYSAQSSSSTKSYSTSSSSSSSSSTQDEDKESLIEFSIKNHNLKQLNDNFIKMLSKPYNYYLNDSVFNHIHVKSSNSYSFFNFDDNDVTLNEQNEDTQSDSSSDTSFSRYAPTDDDDDF